jgi:hypothetical protein
MMRRFLLAALLVPCAALATTVQWTISGATFEDGGTLTGSFTYDFTNNTISSISVTTTAGGGFPAATFTTLLPTILVNPNYIPLLTPACTPSVNCTGMPALALAFATPITAAGGSVALDLGNGTQRTCTNAACTSVAAPGQRFLKTGVVAGTVLATGIPVLSNSALMSLGLMLAAGGALLLRRNEGWSAPRL